MLNEGRVCWWKWIPTAEMGGGTFDPRQAAFSFLFPSYRGKSEGRGEKWRRMGDMIQVCTYCAYSYSNKLAMMLAACNVHAAVAHLGAWLLPVIGQFKDSR
jgi:hypothetical protein